MTGSSPILPPSRTRWGGTLLTALFVVIASLLFFTIYVSLPANDHYGALLLIGILALLFALASYLAESLSREPTAQRSLAWGFFGMGFATLLLSIGLGPTYGIVSMGQALEGLLVVLIVLTISVGLILWRLRAVKATEGQMVSRGAWRNEPAPSAFSYATANGPSVPTTAPPQPPPPTTPAPPRSP